MPEYLRALLVILALAAAVFHFARPAACAVAIAPEDFARRRRLWFAITLVAFLAHDFWIFVAIATVLLVRAARREENPVALFFLLAFAIPALTTPIPGMGIVNQLFSLSYPRLLALTILLPAALALYAREAAEKESLAWPDRLLAAYVLLTLALQLGVDSFTNTLRYGFYALLDVALPYYVASRSLRDLRRFRDALMSFVLAAMLLAAIGAFEFGKKWLLYSTLDGVLGVDWGYGEYLSRDNSLRALATTGQPIALGYVMAVACGIFLFLSRSAPTPRAWYIGLALLAIGLFAPLSRGPWLGAGVIAAVFAATGRRPVYSLFRLGLAGAAALAIALASPLGERIVQHLPFVGTIDAANVVYRQRLLEASLTIVRQHPWFGSSEFLGQMEDLRQGQGIIDIVNTYLGIVLTTGVAGLALFVSCFAAIALRIRRAMLGLADRSGEAWLLGRAMLATLAGILVIIFTVSSITVIPLVYWSVAGLGMACARLLASQGGRPAPARPLSGAIGGARAGARAAA